MNSVTPHRAAPRHGAPAAPAAPPPRIPAQSGNPTASSAVPRDRPVPTGGPARPEYRNAGPDVYWLPDPGEAGAA